MEAKNEVIPSCKIHYGFYICTPVLIAVSSGLAYFFQKGLGKTMLGTCAIKSGSFTPILSPLVPVIYLILGGMALRALKNWKVMAYKEKVKKQYFSYVIWYIVSLAFLWLVMSVSYFMVFLNCTFFHNEEMQIFNFLASLSKLGVPLISPLLRGRDPYLQLRMRKLC